MGLKDRLRRLEREAEEDGIVIRLQDGTVRVFERTVVAVEMFAARMSLRGCANREQRVRLRGGHELLDHLGSRPNFPR